MSNKEQGRVVMSQLGGFFKYILENIPHNSLQFYSVGHSNHGGDFEHSIMTALSIMLENMGVKTYVSTRPIDHFKLGDKTIIFAHGNIYFKIVIIFILNINISNRFSYYYTCIWIYISNFICK